MNDVEAYDTKEYKKKRAKELRAIDVTRYQLDAIDRRLYSYAMEVIENPDRHNLYELLALLKFFRLLDTYVFLPKKIKRFARFYESLKFSGLNGRRCYKLTDVQYFQFASILGFYYWEDVGAAEGQIDSDSDEAESGRKAQSERKKERDEAKLQIEKIADGRRYELRRLVRDVILFVPRKFSKTTSTASLAIYEFLFGDANAQAYTAANSYKQAKICYDEIRKIAKQLDPKKKNFKSTRETLKWRDKNRYGKESIVECLSGGGDTKDGLNASLIIFDEYAQAKYVRDRSEGAELLQVLTSSMGTRREPLTVIITTASRVSDGPFTLELQNAKDVLLDKHRDDTQFAALYMPDAWELDTDSLGSVEVWKKCNPHIGITVQESYYKSWWLKAQRDAEKMLEFKTKLLNIFSTDTINAWMPSQLARTWQCGFDINEMPYRADCMVGMDLSVWDDFSVVVYNVYNSDERKFYIWLDAYIPEETLNEHPNSELYKVWVKAGYMKVCPGAVINDTMIVSDILERNAKVRILQIGYDAYKSQEIVNSLGAAIYAEGAAPENVLRAVPQTYGAFTSPVETFEMAALSRPCRVATANNPIIAYCFGNCFLDIDKMNNKKPLKRAANLKIDAAIATLETFWLYNNYEE